MDIVATLKQQITELEQQREQVIARANMVIGALEASKALLAKFTAPDTAADEPPKEPTP